MALKKQSIALMLLTAFICTLLIPFTVFAETAQVTLNISPNPSQTFKEGDIITLTPAITNATDLSRVDFYDGDALIGSKTAVPYTFLYVNIKGGEHKLIAKAVLSDGTTVSSVPISIQAETAQMQWVKKYEFGFDGYDGTLTTGKFPGSYSPTLSTSQYGATFTPASGVYGRDVSDVCLKATTVSDSKEISRIYIDRSVLKDPINTMIFQADLAFSKPGATIYFGYFKANGGSERKNMLFTVGGKVQYVNSNGTWVPFKDENGNDVIYSSQQWHHVAVKFDYTNKKVQYYLDNIELKTTNGELPCPEEELISDITELSIRGMSDKYNPQTEIYYDNFSIAQEQSTSTSCTLTSPTAESYYQSSSVELTADATAGLNDSIDRVEFYANGELLSTATQSPYTYTMANPDPNHYNIIARAVSTNGLAGYSAPKNITVDSIKIPKLFADNMILQRNKNIRIYGEGISGHRVSATLNNDTAETIIKDNKWEIILPPQPATKSTNLVLKTDSGVETIIHNVAIGEVIVCAGQSNMAYSFSSFTALIPQVDKDYDDIRLFKQPSAELSTPQNDIPQGEWNIATVMNAKTFSAFGFLTAKKYYLEHNGEIPVGLLFAAIGGSSIYSWLPNEDFENDPDLITFRGTNASYMFNAMASPLRNFTVGSVIWYQGEGNTFFTSNYEKALTRLIEGWRNQWRDQSLPFIIIQLPIYNYLVKYDRSQLRCSTGVRDGEFNVSQRLSNVATVISIDTGEELNIHPSNKLPLAERAMLALKHFTNPEDTSFAWKSPSFDYVTREPGKLIIHFKDTADGLKLSDGSNTPLAFEVRGDDGIYTPANATLVNDTIEIDTSAIQGTAQARYAWSDIPKVNVVSSADLPLAPFMTDQLEKFHFGTRVQGATIDLDTFTDPLNFAPVVKSVTPSNDAIAKGDSVQINVNAVDYDGEVEYVSIYADNNTVPLAMVSKNPRTDNFSYTWENPTEGAHTIYAIATDNDGTTSLKQDATLGTREVSPVKNTFIAGNYKANEKNLFTSDFNGYNATDNVTPPAQLQNAVTLANGATINSSSAPLTANNILKITTNASGQIAAINIPTDNFTQTDREWKLTIDTSLYFTSDGAENEFGASRSFNVLTNNNYPLTLFTFYNKSTSENIISPVAYKYSIGKATFVFKNNVWYHVKMEINLKNATFNFSINDKYYYKNVSFAQDGNQTVLSNLKTGIKSASITQSGTSALSTSTYIERLNYSRLEYQDAPADTTETYQFLPFKDLSGEEITSFSGRSGVSASALIANNTGIPITGVLVIAAYNGDRLIAVKFGNTLNTTVAADSTETITASLTSQDIANATSVKAFVIDSLYIIKPCTILKSIPKSL